MRSKTLAYHNLNHIRTMLSDSQDDYCSDEVVVAVCYHDIVYDAEGFNVHRSAKLFRNIARSMMIEDEDFIDRVFNLIMVTDNHLVDNKDDTAAFSIVSLDLRELTDIFSSHKNFFKILVESQSLYNVNERDAAQGSLQFMTRFKENLHNHYLSGNFYPYQEDFIRRVLEGIDYTIKLSKDILEKS